jgi:tetratricopeptide (TPR) repeat protein
VIVRTPARALLAFACVLTSVAALGFGIGTAAAQQSAEAEVATAEAALAYEDKRYDEALTLLRAALAQDPANADALYYTGLVLLAQGKPAEAAEALEKARAAAPDDLNVLYQLGVAYVTRRDYERAEAPLTRVLQAAPQTEGIGYYVGLVRYHKRDYRGALEAFRASTSSDPDTQQLTRFYSSLALASLGEAPEAAAEAEQALRIPSATALTGVADRLRDTMATARERSRRFHAELRAGFLYDTNVSLLPRPSHDPTAEAVRQLRDQHSIGELLGLRLDYAWLRTGPWESSVSYSFFQVFYNDLPKFNVTNHLFGLSGAWLGALGGMPLRLVADYAFDTTLLDGDAFLDRHTVSASATLVENAGSLTALQARFQDKSFSELPLTVRAEQRSADNWMVGGLHVFRFAADRHYVRLGYQFDIENADGRDYSYRGHRLLAGGQYTLPWGGLRLKYDFDLHQRDYVNDHALLPAANPNSKAREDTEQTHVVRVEKPLPFNMTLAGEYQGIVNHSNVPLYSLSRSVFSLILSWRY